jgi:hypothetical protein
MSSISQNVIKHKVGLLNLAAELGNVSRACKVMGFSRDTFYRYQSAVETGGVDALIDANRKKPNLRNRVEDATEKAVMAFAIEQPAFGQVRVSNELRSAVSSFLHRVSAQFGYAMTWSLLRNACPHWSVTSPKPVRC